MCDDLILQLNAKSKAERLSAASELKTLIDEGKIDRPVSEGYTNNHIHTTFSFSPYSPSKAVWMALMNGLSTAGIIDHDSVGGAEEFITAGEMLKVPVTVGFEIRTDWSDTRLKGKRINNPDQLSNAYICAHGLPHNSIEKADMYLSRIRRGRGIRNRAMTENINKITARYGILIDYDKDVLPLSFTDSGGEVTERHLLYALCLKLTDKYGKGKGLTDFLTKELGITLSAMQSNYLGDSNNSFYEYDLLNVLKSSFVSQIFIEASGDETPPVKETVEYIKECGAVPSYCYLGDVGASPTGDKKAQKFEDDYIAELFEECRELGFQAIAFMPSRNTVTQLELVMGMCKKYGFMQISGEDINQPRQSFICKQLKDPRFSHLSDAAWALIGHEKAATKDIRNGIFADGKPLSPEQMNERIEKYKTIATENEE